MTRVTRPIEFPFNLNDYRVLVVMDGIEIDVHEVCVLVDGVWRVVRHPSPELRVAITEAVKKYDAIEGATR